MSVEISNLPELVAQLTTSDFTPVVHNGTTYKHKTASYFVRKSEDETITGVKTFSSSPIVPDGDASGEAVNYGQLSTVISSISDLDSAVVKLTGAQTIADVKTFSSSPIVPTPTTGTQAANKTYVDAAISELGATVEISANYTVVDGVTKIVVTTANAVTITIPAGFDLHYKLTINRTVSASTKITVATSGSETVEGGSMFVTHGSRVTASLAQLQEVTLEKVSSANWRFVSGIVSGSTANGSYEKYPTGKGRFTGISSIGAFGTQTNVYGNTAGYIYRGQASISWPFTPISILGINPGSVIAGTNLLSGIGIGTVSISGAIIYAFDTAAYAAGVITVSWSADVEWR